MAFWIAVVGNTQSAGALTLGRSLVVAVCVVLGASAWGLVLCSAVRMGARFATPLWDVVTQGATGVLNVGSENALSCPGHMAWCPPRRRVITAGRRVITVGGV